MKKYFSVCLHLLWSLFLNGLLTLLPIALTILIFAIPFRLVIHWLAPVAQLLPPWLEIIPHVEIILALIFILFIGLILRLFVVSPLLHAFERFIARLPLVSPVYSGVKQLVEAFSGKDQLSFK